MANGVEKATQAAACKLSWSSTGAPSISEPIEQFGQN